MILQPLYVVGSMNKSSKNIRLLNSIIGMCKSDKKWPNYLFREGYAVFGIEVPFKNANGNTVEPDLVISSAVRNNAMLLESKTGSIEEEQARHYSSVTRDDVVDKLFINTPDRNTFSFDIPYLCFSDNKGIVQTGLDKLSLPFPIVEVADTYIKLVHNKLSVPPINEAFKNGFRIEINRIPMGYYNFDDTSTDGEIAPHVIQTLVSFAARSEPVFTEEKLAKEAVGSLWDILQPQKQGRIKKRIKTVLRKARSGELSKFLTRIRPDRSQWRIDYARGKGKTFPTGTLRSLSRECKNFVNRIIAEEHGEGQLGFPFYTTVEEE